MAERVHLCLDPPRQELLIAAGKAKKFSHPLGVHDRVVSRLADLHVEAVDRERSKLLGKGQHVLWGSDFVRENSVQGLEVINRMVWDEASAKSHEAQRLDF